MYQSSKTNRNAVDYICAMEAEPISKNGVSPKNHTNRSKWNMRVIPIMLMMCFVGTAWSQTTYNIQLGTTYSETVTSGSYNRYAFSVTKEGMLTVNISTDGSAKALPYQGATFRLLNSNGETLKTFITPTGFPYSDDYSIASIGDYQIEIFSEYGGTFTMRADCFVDEAEPNNTIATAMSLPNSGCTVSGTLTSSDVDMYKYVLTQPGRFTVSASLGSSSNGGVGWAYVKWYNSDGTQIGSSSAYTTYNDYMDLEAGTYYISVSQYSSYTGTYSLIGNFTATGNNEIEPNNTTTNAQSLTLGQTVKGFISYQDKIDMYKYVLAQPGRFTVNAALGSSSNGGVYYAVVKWYSSDGTQIKSSSNFTTYNDYMDLEAGTYYIELKPQNSSYTGTYTLTGTIRYANAATPTITEQPVGATYTHNATATALSVTATTDDDGTLTYQWYRNTTNSTTGGISVGTDSTYTPPTTSVGTYYYYVEVTNTNNSVTGTKRVSVTSNAVAVEVTAGTGIADISSAQLSVYPNPVREELFIKSETPIKKVEIYTLSGTLLLYENNFNEKISVSTLPKGVYLLKVYSGREVAVSKIVKE